MKCSRCGRELSEDQSYVHENKVLCEDCLMNIGLSIRECDPWASYSDARAPGKPFIKGSVMLTDSEQRIFEFVKKKGRATREEVMKNFNMDELALKAQLITLMHSEKVKERGEGNQLYLVPID
ncbi:MAG: hypothetical protein HY670_01155 [Chloroflexi bacterium]|nr:hypothetical protein [Chloroflexota bacterium]